MTSTIRARFARKPYDLGEVLRNSDPDALPEPIKIEFCKELTDAEYDDFTNSLLMDRDWLAGHGGYLEGNGRSVVEVTAPNRTTLYVDPSGSKYGRYVGIRVE
jgi:hypothetical protein